MEPVTALKLSVIVPFFGDPAETMPLLAALDAQTNAPHEVIVVDDASPMPFPETPGIRLYRQDRNAGFGTTVNAGARLASGDYLLVLNSDLTIPATLIEELGAAATGKTMVASPAVIEHGKAAHTARRWPSVRNTFFSWLTPLARWRDRPLWRRLVGHHDPAGFDAAKPVDWVVGACLLLPAQAFSDVGGFDERFQMNSEEVDLQRRLAQLGIRAHVLAGITVEHASGGSSDPLRRRQWLVDGWFRYFAKWGGATRLRLALLFGSGLNLVWNAVRRLRGAKIAPIETFRQERRLISHAWETRLGKRED